MKKIININKILSVSIIMVVIISILAFNNIIGVKANEDNKEHAYKRSNHLDVDNNGELVISRKHLGNKEMGQEDAWTLFIYMCGSDLETDSGEATKDIDEIIEAASSKNVNIIIQTGGSNKWQKYDVKKDKIQRYKVEEDSLVLLDTLTRDSMAESRTLESFVSWGVENYPAEHMGMIYWNHGGGSIYGACMDEYYQDLMTLSEFEKALSNGTKNMTDKFDFIGFDACLMATLETANTFVPFADYFIASEEAESCSGWEYTSMINALVDNPDKDVKDLGKVIIDSFMTTNIEEETEYMATLSMTDLSKIDDILYKFNKVARKMYEMSDDMDSLTLFTKFAHESENYSEGEGFDVIDFADYMSKISEIIPEAKEVEKLVKDAIVYERHGKVFENTYGLSFYYCYGNMTFSDMNILRNITVSPYWLNLIEKLCYGAIYKGNLDGFNSNNWENNKYYYDEDYSFVRYEFKYDFDYNETFKNEEYFSEATFDDIWYKWFEDMSNNYYRQSFEFSDGEITLYIPETEDEIQIDNNYTQDELRKIAKGTYNIVIDDGKSMDILGQIGTFEEKVSYNGRWFALSNGQLLVANKINEGNGLSLYKAPVLINGEEGYILFVVDSKDNILILQSWNEKNEDVKSANRVKVGIKDGMMIAPIYTSVNYSTSEITIKYGEAVAAKNDMIRVIDLNDISFASKTLDAFGNADYSSPVKM